METTGIVATIIAIITSFTTVATGVWGFWQAERRKEAEEGRKENDYIIGQYDKIVEKIKAEFTADGEKIARLEIDYIRCREECVRREEKIQQYEAQLAEYRRRV